MENLIKSKPTIYNGYEFRSRQSLNLVKTVNDEKLNK